jgi:predicted N-acyltransferase
MKIIDKSGFKETGRLPVLRRDTLYRQLTTVAEVKPRHTSGCGYNANACAMCTEQQLQRFNAGCQGSNVDERLPPLLQ